MDRTPDSSLERNRRANVYPIAVGGETLDLELGSNVYRTEMSDAAGTQPNPVELIGRPDHPPIACTLDGGSMPDRLADWRALLDHTRSRVTTADGALRIEFEDHVPVGDLAQLVAAEQNCCAFFAFAITVDQRGVPPSRCGPPKARMPSSTRCSGNRPEPGIAVHRPAATLAGLPVLGTPRRPNDSRHRQRLGVLPC